jgi:hypothetical protein
MVNGQWLMYNGQWSMVNGQWSKLGMIRIVCVKDGSGIPACFSGRLFLLLP